jgi:dihydrofolate synthase/folylpolyglutamate synthase
MSKAGERIEALLRLHPKGFDLSLGRIRRLLSVLGDPQNKLPPVIHVAGTNGKGSTIAFLRAIFEAAGLRVHVDTSPHLVSWHERFRLSGKLVSDEVLSDAIDRVAEANKGEAITVFELLTAVMFVLFAEEDADVALVEVGLGGRFDCTNVMDEVALSVISMVGMDHEAWLGDTLGKIAFEKAGIIKKMTPVIIGNQDSEALEVIEQQADKMRAPASIYGQHFHASEEHGRMVWQGEDRLLDLPLPGLFGNHQVENAATAIMAAITFAEGQNIKLNQNHIAQGLKNVSWPARMQHLRRGKLVDVAPQDAEIWLDGGHNPAAGAVIVEYIQDLNTRDPRPLILIAGMLDTKDASGFLTYFRAIADCAVAIPVLTSEAGIPAEKLASILKQAGFIPKWAPSLENAVASISESRPRVLITGSLYVAGDALAANGTPPS